MSNKRTKQNLFQVLKFGLVGIGNTAVDYVAFYIFFVVFGIDKNIAQIAATILAMTNSYLLNRYWTFERKGAVRTDEIGKFILVNLLSMGTTLLCLNLFYDFLHIEHPMNAFLAAVGIPFAFTGSGAVLLAKLAAMPFSLAVNFLGNRLWVFRKQAKEREE